MVTRRFDLYTTSVGNKIIDGKWGVDGAMEMDNFLRKSVLKGICSGQTPLYTRL